MFLSLSLDITLHILSYLTLPDIAKLYRLCCHTRRFLCDNEDAIYHQFAVRLHFVPQGCGLGELIAKNPVWLKDVKTWKDLYERWVVLNHNWSGRGTVTQGGYLWYGSDDVRYFKVDEQDQTVLAITATEPLTLTVRDIEDGTLFWCLEGVTKVELTDRFMLVWGRRQGVEIWRRANYAPHEKVRSSLRELSTLSVLPSQLQQSTPAFAPETIWAKRGVYVFHGFLRPTVGLPFLTYRFKGSLAAVVDTSEMHTVKLYNLEEGALVRSFDLNTIIHQNIGTQELRVEPASFVLLDIDLSTDHLCVAFDWALVVVPLEDAPAAGSVIVFSDRRAPLDVRRSGPRLVRSEDRGTSKSATCSVLDRKNKVFTIPSGAGSQETFTVALPNTSGTNLTPEDAWRPGAEWSPCFVSVRFSPDGQHLVAGSAFGLLYLLPDFPRVLCGDVAADKIVQRLNFHEPISYISWYAHDRIMTVLDSKDAVVVALSQIRVSQPVKSDVTLDNARAIKLCPLTDSRLGGSHNLQMTRTRLWFSARPDRMYQQLQANLGASGDEADLDASVGDVLGSVSSGMTVCFMDLAGRM